MATVANPICLSPLKFYESASWQNHKRSYAYGHISPLITQKGYIQPFQFVIPAGDNVPIQVFLCTIDGSATIELRASEVYVENIGGYNLVISKGIHLLTQFEGEYYIKIKCQYAEEIEYYSEVLCFKAITPEMDDYMRIVYKNSTGNFMLKNGIISFDNNFEFELYIIAELGKPNYNFEEELTKRLGYNFIESQVSKKVYKFNTVVPEYICDALRIIRLCDSKKLTYKGQEYDMLSFDMDVDWQTQGDLASVTCEFEVDNVIVNLGGFIPQTE